MAENSPRHIAFVTRFLERLADIEGERLSDPELAKRLNDISGGGWDKSKVSRLRKLEVQKYTLDDYEALAFLVGSTVDEMTSDTLRGRELHTAMQREAFTHYQDTARELVKVFDELTKHRNSLIEASERLRKLEDSGAPFDLDVWQAPLLDGKKDSGTTIHTFVAHIKSAIAAMKKRSEVVKQDGITRFDREKKAEGTLDKLLAD